MLASRVEKEVDGYSYLTTLLLAHCSLKWLSLLEMSSNSKCRWNHNKISLANHILTHIYKCFSNNLAMQRYDGYEQVGDKVGRSVVSIGTGTQCNRHIYANYCRLQPG